MSAQKFFVKLALATAIVSGTASLTGCGEANASNNVEQKEEKVATIPVEVTSAITGDISSNYSTTAVLEAREEAEVMSKVAGIIKELYVEEGDYVKEGQILAKIESERYQLNLDKSKAELARIKSELERIKKVHGKRLVSADTYEKLKWDYEAAKVAVDIAKLDLKETNIVAPIDGYVAQRYVKKGNLIQQYQANSLFHIVQSKELQGIVHLPEQQLWHVKKGLNAKLKFSGSAIANATAVVERISPIIDEATGTFKVTLKVPNSDDVLKPGMFASVDIQYKTHTNTILVPHSAVISMDNTDTLFVVENNVVTKKTVQTGFKDDQFVEVLDGLNMDEVIVTAGHANLKDQAQVQIIDSI